MKKQLLLVVSIAFLWTNAFTQVADFSATDDQTGNDFAITVSWNIPEGCFSDVDGPFPNGVYLELVA